MGFVVEVFRGGRDDRLTGLAAEVAFFGALSVLPTLIRDLFDRSNGDIFTIAVLLALVSGSRGIDAAVNAIVLVSNDVEARPWWKRRLLSLAMLLGTVVAGAVAVSMFVVGPVLGGARDLADQLGRGEAFVVAWRWLRYPLGALAVTLWSVAVLHVARPHARSWRADLVGASVTTVLWIVLSVGLRLYLATIGRSNAALGALGGPLILLLWFYLLALALLVGAEVAQQVREATNRRTGRENPSP